MAVNIFNKCRQFGFKLENFDVLKPRRCIGLNSSSSGLHNWTQTVVLFVLVPLVKTSNGME